MKKNKKIRISFSRLILYSCIALILTDASCAIIKKSTEISEKKKEIQTLEKQYSNIINKNEYLEGLLDSSDTYDYQIQKAREYNYCFPEEKIFYSMDGV